MPALSFDDLIQPIAGNPPPVAPAVNQPIAREMAPGRDFAPPGGWPADSPPPPPAPPQTPAVPQIQPQQMPTPAAGFDGAAEKAKRIADATAAYQAAKAKPLDAYMNQPAPDVQAMIAGGMSDMLSPDQMRGMTREEAAAVREADIAQAKRTLQTVQGAPTPTMTPAESFGRNLVGGAMKSALSIGKLPAEVASDLGAPGALNAIKSADQAAPQGEQLYSEDPAQQLAGPLGSAAPYMLGGAAGLGIRGLAALGALSGAGEQKEAAENAGASKTGQYLAAALGGGVGAAQALPLGRIIERVEGPGSANLIANMLTHGLKGGAENAAVTGAGQLANNAIAKAIYDKDRDLFDGVTKDAVTAGAVGMLFGIPAGTFVKPAARQSFAEALESGDYHDWFDQHPEFHTTRANATEVNPQGQLPAPAAEGQNPQAPSQALPSPSQGPQAPTDGGAAAALPPAETTQNLLTNEVAPVAGQAAQPNPNNAPTALPAPASPQAPAPAPTAAMLGGRFPLPSGFSIVPVDNSKSATKPEQTAPAKPPQAPNMGVTPPQPESTSRGTFAPVPRLPAADQQENGVLSDVSRGVQTPVAETAPANNRQPAPADISGLAGPASAAPAAVTPDAFADKWFGTADKAQGFIDKQGIGATHQVVPNGRRFEIKPVDQSSALGTPAATLNDLNAAMHGWSVGNRADMLSRAENIYARLPEQLRPQADKLMAPLRSAVGQSYNPTPRDPGYFDRIGGFLTSEAHSGAPRPGKNRDPFEIVPGPTDAAGRTIGHVLQPVGMPASETGHVNGIHFVDEPDGGIRIITSQLPEDMQGQRLGTKMYMDLIGQMYSQGRSVSSDQYVSPPATKVWERVRQEFEDVHENPGTETLPDGSKLNRTGPVYSMVPKRGQPQPERTPEARQPLAPQAIAMHLYDTGALSRDEAGTLAGIDPRDKANGKALDETIEHGVVLAARKIISDGAPEAETLKRLVQLYDDQPKLGARTSTSVAQQAYSTPAPLGYVAQRLADVKPGDKVLEPTAGNGMLVSGVAPKNAVVNELNGTRAEALTAQGFQPTKNDAAEPGTFAPKSVDKVITNPPFGAVKGNDGESKVFDLGDIEPGYKTHEIDHAIALRALQAMKDDGKATLILGGVNKLATDRTGAYAGKAKREFYNTLYRHYNVTDHFTVPGELYEKQGAGWPVDVIQIQGRGRSSLPPPMRQAPPIVSSWNEIGDRLARQRNAGLPAPAGEQGSQPALEHPSRPAPAADAGGGTQPQQQQSDAGRPAAVGRSGGVQPNGVRGERGARPAGWLSEPAARPHDNGGGSSEGRGGSARRPVQLTPEEETAGQVAYQPGAKEAGSLGTLVPRNMAEPTHRAIQELIAKHGPLEGYIGDRLGMSLPEVRKAFSAEQVDGLSMAIDNLEHGAGAIIGDATGIGKGRIAAGVLAYAKRQNRVPIFVTEKPNLYTDMVRDLTAIGYPEPKVAMTNKTIEGGGLPLEDGTLLKPAKGIDQVLQHMAGEGELPGHDFLFTTYSQMDPVQKKETLRRQAVSRAAPNAIFVFDEAHNVGEVKDDWSSAAGIPYRADFFRDLVNRAAGVTYLSATYAKRPGNMDFYRRTDMIHAVDKPENIGPAFSRGGIPMQEAVASMLADAGQYIRRERSFKGITFDTRLGPIDRGMLTQFARALRAINDFSNSLKEPLKQMRKNLAAEAKGFKEAGGATGSAGISSTRFSSLMHNLIGQVLFASNAKEAARAAIDEIKAGRRPVIALQNTMDTIIDEFMRETGAAPGDPATIAFNNVLSRYLERSRDVTIDQGYGRGSKRHRLTDDEIGGIPLMLYSKAQDAVRDVDFGDLPVSPIDFIHGEIRKAGYKSGEVTGRSAGIDYSGDTPVYALRDKKEIAPAGRVRTINAFNARGLDAMTLNAAGATGVSLHDSKDFPAAGRGQRTMIITQPNPDPNTFMQMLGRVNRTGQLTKPGYIQLAAAAPAETRSAAVLQKKMASLNANTTAAQNSSVLKENVPDFFNKYGDQLAQQLMAENPDLSEQMGHPLGSEAPEGDGDGSAVRRLTGHISLLDLEDQERVMGALVQRYKDLMQMLEEAGENTMSTPHLDLDAKYLSGQDIVPMSGNGPFRAAAHLATYDVKSQAKPVRFDELKTMWADNLNLDEARRAGLHDMGATAAMNFVGKQGQAKQQELVQQTAKEFDAYRQKVLATRTDPEAQAKLRTALNDGAEQTRRLMGMLPIGMRVTMAMPDGAKRTGYVTNFRRSIGTGNPYAPSDFAVTVATPGNRPMKLPLSQVVMGGEAQGDKIALAPATGGESHEKTAEQFDTFKGDMRERRVIATGNILAAFDRLQNQGRIVRFTDDGGQVRQGIMMSPQFNDAASVASSLGKKATSPQEVLDNLPIQARGEPVTVRKYRGAYEVAVPAAKSLGGKFYLNQAVLDAAGKDFYKVGSDMVLRDLSQEDAGRVIAALHDLGVTFMIGAK